MGTEILGIFIIVPALVFGWNLYRLFDSRFRKHAILNLIFASAILAFFYISSAVAGYPLQGLAIGATLFGPFYLLSWMFVKYVVGPTWLDKKIL